MNSPQFRIAILERARKTLADIDKGTHSRIGRAISDLAIQPEPSGCKTLKGYPHLRRIRVGDYRVVYHIDQGTVTVLVVLVGHRRDVYDIMKRLPTAVEALRALAAAQRTGESSRPPA